MPANDGRRHYAPHTRRHAQQHPAVTVRYSAVGSSAGIAAFTGQHADFGASDVPMTATEQAAAHGGALVQVPVDLGAEVVVCHLPGLPRLHPTGPVRSRSMTPSTG
jgi:phosphate transport system substrate-binding protein